MYNLLEYGKNYSTPSGSSWNYYRDEVNDAPNDLVVDHMINNNKTTFFEYKTNIIRIAPVNDNK